MSVRRETESHEPATATAAYADADDDDDPGRACQKTCSMVITRETKIRQQQEHSLETQQLTDQLPENAHKFKINGILCMLVQSLLCPVAHPSPDQREGKGSILGLSIKTAKNRKDQTTVKHNTQHRHQKNSAHLKFKLKVVSGGKNG